MCGAYSLATPGSVTVYGSWLTFPRDSVTSEDLGARGNALPEIRSPVPGEACRALARRLSQVESRNVTFVGDPFPIFWTRAEGSNVWDADGNRYVDLTAGFGVAAVGHRHPRVEKALRTQASRLVHGMGDVHPPEVKVELLEELAGVAPWPETRSVLGLSGGEAVEIALKTAVLVTGKPGVLCFSGAYHGLSYGALAVTDRAQFRAPFDAQLNPHVVLAEYPHPYRPSLALRSGTEWPSPEEISRAALEHAEAALERAGSRVGAVLIEPIQGRGGDVVPPSGYLARLAELCRARGLLLIVDEIYTGFGRAGSWLAAVDEGVTPDLICAGKALSGGMPISACMGPPRVMDAWPESRGEAMHTTTFLGHPLACAAATAAIRALRRSHLPERAQAVGDRWRRSLEALAARHPGVGDVRGRGLMIGLDLVTEHETREPDSDLASRVVAEALRCGWVLLPSGPEGNVISFSPPLTIAEELLEAAGAMLDEVLATEAG